MAPDTPKQKSDSQKSSSGNVANEGNQQGREMSTNEMVREAGFDNFERFLASYRLKIYNTDDVEEGKAILRAMFEKK